MMQNLIIKTSIELLLHGYICSLSPKNDLLVLRKPLEHFWNYGRATHTDPKV